MSDGARGLRLWTITLSFAQRCWARCSTAPQSQELQRARVRHTIVSHLGTRLLLHNRTVRRRKESSRATPSISPRLRRLSADESPADGGEHP